MSDSPGPVLQPKAVDIQIRRHYGAPTCDVVIAVRGQKLIVPCPDYDRALSWALMECKSYRVTPNFPEQTAALRDG